MDLKEVGYDYMNWIHPAQDLNHCRALVNTIKKTGKAIPVTGREGL
jgi:hypothetical protein